MRRLVLSLAVAMVVGLAPIGPPAGGSDDGRPGVPQAISASGSAVPGDVSPLDLPGPAKVEPAVLVAAQKAAPGGTIDVIVSLDRPAGGQLRETLSRLGPWSRVFEHIPAAAIRLPAASLGDLRQLPGVLGVYAEKPLQYFLRESADLNNTTRAWNDLGVTGKGVTVAIIDTGVDFTHPDLAPAMRANVKLLGFGSPPPAIPIDGLRNSDTSSGHGTHVAGDVAGRGTASGGLYKGMAYGADLVGLGTGDGLSVFTDLEAFEWILENRERYGIRVVNNSYGTSFQPYDASDPVVRATKLVSDAGVVVVFANGNDGDEMSMNPYAVPPWVLPVAAGTKTGSVTDFSSGGIEADTVGLGFAKVDVAGETRRPLDMGLYHPAVTTTGENVVSTRSNTTITPILALPGDARALPPDQLPYYHTLSGTSMASPEAAGIAALLLEAAPELTPAQVRMVLQITARPIPGVPFHKQGYGHTDASAAVDLARRLHNQPAADVEKEIEALQAARDQAVLDTLDHPTHTWAQVERGPVGSGTLVHKVEVPSGTERVKVLTNGSTIPFVGLTSYEITVTDAAATIVGSASADAASGTTALDLELRQLVEDADKAFTRFAELSFGTWTVEIAATGSLVSPIDADLTAETISTIVSIFGPRARPCRSQTEFAPTGILGYRLQGADGQAGVVPFPLEPGYTYVGPLPDGALGQRTPERRLAGTFGQLTSSATPPTFVTAPLSAPITLGGGAELRTWIRGPSEAATGLLAGELIDVDDKGVPRVIGTSPPDIPVKAASTEPLETTVPMSVAVPYTVPPGHRIGVRMTLSFVGTSAHTLYYDSDQYPSGVMLTTGDVVTRDSCPAPPG